MNESDKFAVNRDLVVEAEADADKLERFYKGRGYTIFRLPKIETNSLGVLLPSKGNEGIISVMKENRDRIDSVLNPEEVEMISIILHLPIGIPQVLVNMPPSGYVCLADMEEMREGKDIVEKLLKREKSRGIYKEEISARDFWVDPENKKLFFIALDKLK